MSIHRALLPVILSIGLISVACSDDTTAEETTTTTTETTTTTTEPSGPEGRASAGCDGPTGAGTEELTLTTTDGREREYRRHVPASYDPARPTPLVLNFHGFTSNIDAQVGLSRLEPLSETETFMVVTPQGDVNSDGTTFWNVPPLSDSAGPDDVAFMHELLDRVEADLCIDLDRVFATGMSNGGFMSSYLGCVMPDRIAAFASVTGIVHTGDCATNRPMPVLHVHGTADGVVPFDFIPSLVEQWAIDSGCTTDPEITGVSDEVELREFPDCDDEGEVDFYVVDGGGHTWPGTELPPDVAAVLGYTTLDIDATALAWQWFVDHPMS